MKKNLLVILFALFTTAMFAQTLETVMWGNPKDLPKKTSFQKIIGTNDDGFYAIRADNPSFITRDKMWLEFVSYATMDVDESNEIQFPGVNNKQTYYNDMFFIKDKLILFTSVKDRGRSQNVLYMEYMNTNGTLKNKPKEVGVTPASNLKEDGFNFKYLKDEKNIMLYYHKTYTKYNGEKFSIKIFDSNLKEVFAEDLVFPKRLMERKNKLNQIERGKSGNIYMMFSVEAISTKSTRGKKKGDKFENVLVVYNVKKKEFKTYDVKMTKFVTKSVKFTLTDDETVVIAGTFAPRTSKFEKQFTGMFYMKINPKTEKEIKPKNIKETFYDIKRDKKLISTFNSERTGATQNDRYSFDVKSVEKLENGGFVVIAEQYFKSFRTYKDPQTKEEIKILYHNYNDLLVGGIDKNGKFAWIKRFPKMQYSIDDGGHFSSFATMINVNTVKLIYNDVDKNIKNENADKTKTIKFNPKTAPKGVAVMHSIYTDGSIQKTPMFSGKDGECVIIPKTLTPFTDGYIIATQKGKKYRFAQFIVE